jgi:filamentous hemagglutinin
VSDTHFVSDVGSSVKVGGASSIAIGGDLTATGANIDLGGGGVVAAKGNVTLQAATATSTVDSNSSGSDHHGDYSESLHTSDDVVTGTKFRSGDGLAIVSGKDINVMGSTVALDKGNALLMASGNVNVGATMETHVSNSDETHSHSGVGSHTSAANRVDQTATYADGSTISADGVAVVSGKDINVTGSNIVGTNAVALGAKGSVNILAATDTYQDSEYHDVKHSGLSGSGGIGFSFGSSEQKDQYDANSVTQSQSRSTVGAVQGNVTITAGKDIHIGGSDIIAGQAEGDVAGATGNISIAGQNVTIDPSQDSASSDDQQEARSSGLTVAFTGMPLEAARDLKANASSGNAFQRTQNVLNGIGASAADTPSIAVSYGSSQPLIKATVSIGGGSSHSDSQSSEVMNDGSTLHAGGTVSIVATGSGAKDANGFATDGDINARGTQISGQDVLLNAARDINLQSAQDTNQQSSHNSSSGGSIGVGLALGGQQNGFTIELSANSANGHANGNGVTTRDTQINAANTVTLTSGTCASRLASGLYGRRRSR